MKQARGIANHLGLQGTGISLIFTDNGFIREINRKYRGKDRPTDVISFAYRENPFPDVNSGHEDLGDIYLSLEQASLQAEKFSVSLSQEILRLMIHGILHLIGHDHEKSKSRAAEMTKAETEIFAVITAGVKK